MVLRYFAKNLSLSQCHLAVVPLSSFSLLSFPPLSRRSRLPRPATLPPPAAPLLSRLLPPFGATLPSALLAAYFGPSSLSSSPRARSTLLTPTPIICRQVISLLRSTLSSNTCVQAPQRCGREGGPSPKGPPPSALLYMVTDKKRNTPGLGRRQSSRDTLWFRRPPPRRSRVTDMNREEKVSPTYHHRRSTGAPILSAGASARSPVGSARAGSTAARVWVVDRRADSVWRRCSPGSREADVSRPAGRRNSDGRVKTPPCGMCAERVAQCAASC